ncbi:MAG: Rieske (2Fe-2S) protein [Gemmatimonadaceae bacterium]|nr:Rieske (2Fe-2S) protein [Gemmatimonadaceae bacterium]
MSDIGRAPAHAVASLADVPVGTLRAVTLPSGEKVCLVHTVAGVCALADRCTHRDFPLSAGEVTPDGLVECAWHGAQFDPRTGVMLTGPGGDDVRTYQVQVEDDTILITPTTAGS